MSYNVKNYTEQGGEKTVIGGEIEVTGTLTVADGATVTGITDVSAAATASALGGVKAATKGAGDTVECKIDTTSSKLYVPTYPVLAAAGADLGGIKAGAKGAGDTVEVKIDATSAKLYVPTYPVLPVGATAEAAGIVKQATNVAEATGDAPTATEFNALLDALIAAGIMAAG